MNRDQYSDLLIGAVTAALPSDQLAVCDRSSFAITTNGYPQADGASVVWMQWEVKPLGVPFDDNDIQQTTAMPIGSRLKAVVRGLQFNLQYRWRARIVSDHPTSPESVWFSIPGSNLTEAKIRGPRVSTLNQDG